MNNFHFTFKKPSLTNIIQADATPQGPSFLVILAPWRRFYNYTGNDQRNLLFFRLITHKGLVSYSETVLDNCTNTL